MTIEEKIKAAERYIVASLGKADRKTLRNDAANIFAENYEEYMTIWSALEG